jgi:hypothetical protein
MAYILYLESGENHKSLGVFTTLENLLTVLRKQKAIEVSEETAQKIERGVDLSWRLQEPLDVLFDKNFRKNSRYDQIYLCIEKIAHLNSLETNNDLFREMCDVARARAERNKREYEEPIGELVLPDDDSSDDDDDEDQ